MLSTLSPTRIWLNSALVGIIACAVVGCSARDSKPPLSATETGTPKTSTTLTSTTTNTPNAPETPETPTPKAAPHPLDKAMQLARACVEEIKNNVDDYTATIVKRERVNGQLGEVQYMYAKIRNRKTKNGQLETPFGVYMQFLNPSSVRGREVIWVEDQNDGKIVAHEGGYLGLLTVYLNPEGTIAMMGQRYPIKKIGLQNLVEELVEKGEGQRQYGECEVRFVMNTKIKDRTCTMIEVVHPEPRAHFDFCRARIFIDDELNMPIRYAAWIWPDYSGEEPLLLEEYTYLNLELNVGLTDWDFDPENREYNYP